MTFEFPAIYNFPPFFTRQPIEQTWLKQCQLWSNLILDYAAEHGIFELELSSETLASSLFTNTTINRRLSGETLQALLTAMVAAGQAEWLASDGIKKASSTSRPPSRCLLYWRKPSEWADLIYSHVLATGQRDQVITIYELFHSEDSQQQPFHQMSEGMWRRAIMVLEKQGKAKLFDSDSVANSLELGVRFF